MKNTYSAHMLMCVLLSFLSFSKSFSTEPVSYWQEITDVKTVPIGERSNIPQNYRAFQLDLPTVKTLLLTAQDEYTPGAFDTGPVISIPMPDGSYSRFRVASTQMMAAELAVNFPMIRTFIAKGVDDRYAVARLDYTQWGFHAMIMSPSGWVFVDPASLGNTQQYISYYRDQAVPSQAFVCEVQQKEAQRWKSPARSSFYRSSGSVLKTYRLALACTGEYAAFYGGTVNGALSGMITSVNRVNGVYELELAVRMVLIANTNLLIYTNASTDPYTNGSGGTMLGENQTNITAVIGSSNYDFGHVFSTGGGGVASLGCICSSGNKARGVTGSGSPVGDSFDLDYVAHEMGHQFGGNHTFNSTTGSCSGNTEPTAAYEPGSGTTIMAYAGICGADDIQSHSDAIFHTKSFDEIQDYITTGNGNSCPVVTSTSNTPPVVASSPNYTIPFQTPFILTGTATDADGDALTYLWEEFDLGPNGAPNSPSGNAPIFRDFVPVTENFRVFPRMQDVVRNTQTKGEILPSYARSLQFRLTARDNKPGGGGVAYNDTLVELTVINTSTPFRVTSPNTAVNWFANTAYTVTWDVSSTNNPPISCSNVNILLSLDSGYTYPYTLITNTPNDGSESVTLPNVTGNKARIKVEAAGNIFFDISNVNFTISSSSPVLSILTTSSLSSNTVCAGSTISIPYTTDGPANAGNVFTAQLSDASGSFASPVTIGTLSSTSAGTINATIPGGTSAGGGYRIRVISSNPAVTGSNNGTNITISQSVATPGSITGTSVVCQGQSGVVFSVPAISNATSYTWTLPSGASIASGSNTNSITVNFSAIASSGSVTVRGSNSGCGNGPVSSPFAVTVNTLPAAAGTISGTTSVCQGQQGVAFSVPSIAGATGYNWTLPSGGSIATGANTNSITADFSSSSSNGLVTVEATNACGAGISSSFTVNALSVPVSPTITTNGPSVFCLGDSVLLSYTQAGNAAIQWRKNGSVIPGANGFNYQATDSGSYDFIAGLPQSFSNSNIVAIPDNSCTGASSTIAVSGYTGTIPSSGISIKVNISHTYVGDLVLVLQAPDGSILGLSNRTGNNNNSGNNFTNTIFSDAGAAVIPTTGAPYTGTYKPVTTVFTSCVTTTVTTFAAIGGGVINPNGNWIFYVYDRSNNDPGSIINWTLNLPASVHAPCTATSNSVSLSLSPGLTTGVNISSNAGTTICSGTPVTFTATPVNGGTTPSYQWKIGNVNVGNGTSVFNPSALSDGDIVTCEMTSNLSCAIGNPATSNALTMTVVPSPIASFTVNVNGPQATFTNTSQYASSYSWDFGDGTFSIQVNPVHTYLQNGNYVVTLTATDSCGTATDTLIVNITTASVANNLLNERQIEILMNGDEVKILYNTNFESCEYKLTAMTGQVLKKGRSEKITTGSMEYISLHGLAAGAYILHLRSDRQSASRIIFKQ